MIPEQTQYGHTLLISDFQPTSSAEVLKRLHFSNGPSGGHYDEAWLQRFIMRYPSVLPVNQIEPAFTPLVPVCIELPTEAGYVDNLLVTPAGNLALVECKLWRNPEARRQVLAQVMDYAKEVSKWSYGDLQNAIGSTPPLEGLGDTTRDLYELVAAKSEIDEAEFHDAVSRNLKRGRFLLLIVGDGIREGVERMAEFLQQHAGFHFTLSFVELALFETPGKQYIVQPRVLARTTNIDRGIVTLDGGRISITPPSSGAMVPPSGRRTTITQESYFEQLERNFPGVSRDLNAFVDALAAYDVRPEYGTDTMILRWRPENGKSWNVGTITTHGAVWLDYLGQQANAAGVSALHKQYLTTLSELVPGACIKKTPKEASWYVSRGGKCVTVDVLVADEERWRGWVRAIRDFQGAVARDAPEE